MVRRHVRPRVWLASALAILVGLTGARAVPALILRAAAPEQPPPVRVVQGPLEVVAMGARAVPGAEAPAGEVPEGLLGHMSWVAFDAHAEGRTAVIAGKAAIYDADGSHFVWSVRVFGTGPDKALVHERHYDDQVFWLDAGNTFAAPSFAERLPLPPGRHRVVLSLYAVAPDFDFRRLKRGEEIRNRVRTLISMGSRLTIE
jgi:hypothetical protein